jgi:transcription elongation factor Elf1
MQPTKPTRPIPERLSKVVSCVSCGDAPGKSVFEGLILCDRCYYHVQFLLKKCKRELSTAFDVYKQILKTAVLEKKLFLQKGKQDAEENKASPVQGKV